MSTQSLQSIRWAFNFKNWNPTEKDLLLATSSIQPEEKERIQKFVFKKDFKSSLIGRLLLRKFVSTATKLPYNEIKFTRDPKGKPILVNQIGDKLCFNVSHQGDYAVLAGELGRTQIGVDVMQMEYSGGKNLTEFFRIMNKNFAASEWENIRLNSLPQKQVEAFFRHWCLKESYVKAIGVGITINLQNISFKINSGLTDPVMDTELFVSGSKVDWCFQESILGGDHCVAVATNNNEGILNTIVKFQELSFDELMVGSIPILEPDIEYCQKYNEKLQRQ